MFKKTERPPSIEEAMEYGRKLKNEYLFFLVGEKDWQCSKGWANRFLLRHGLKGVGLHEKID